MVQNQEGCCEASVQPTLENNQAEKIAKWLMVLADPTRISILNMLAQSESEVCVCDITDLFTKSQPTISHHLKTLRDEGLIQGDKRGKWVYYSLVRSKLDEVKATLKTLEEALGTPLLV